MIVAVGYLAVRVHQYPSPAVVVYPAGRQLGMNLAVTIVVLAAGSLLSAVTPARCCLVLARILQGLGGAAILACSLGLIQAPLGGMTPAGAGRSHNKPE